MVPEPTESAIDEGIDDEEKHGDDQMNETGDECEDSTEDEDEEDYWIPVIFLLFFPQ